jgi:hypothetical protein
MPLLAIQLPGRLCLAASLLFVPDAWAQTVQTDDYLYIAVEAEDYLQGKDARWVVTDPTTPMLDASEDHDANHSDQAGGSTYLELLPDIRVTHEDPFGPPTAYWGAPGTGPQVNYSVDIPEPGRYYVHARLYSTGTEDNGIHVGFNGSWPASGARLQACSAGKGWWWSSAQRDAGGNGSCGTEKTIFLDIQNAGINTISFSAREDGFELDRFVLIKDLSNNTRVCSPVNLDDVNCTNGSIESADEFIDLSVALSSDVDTIAVGEEVVVSAVLENLDGFDVATDIVLELTLHAAWQVVALDERCTDQDSLVTCTLAQQMPTAPNENETFVMTLRATADGELAVDALVSASEVDSRPNNNEAHASVIANAVIPETDIGVSLTAASMTVDVGQGTSLQMTVSNNSAIVAGNVSLALSVHADVTLGALPSECSLASVLTCSIGTLEAGSSKSLTVELASLVAGNYASTATISGANDVNPVNDTATINLNIVEPDTSGGTTDGGTTDGGTTSGSTTSGGTTDGSGTSGNTTSGSGGDTGVDTGGDTGKAKSDSGSMGPFLLLLCLLLWSARLDWRHQRQPVPVRQ